MKPIFHRAMSIFSLLSTPSTACEVHHEAWQGVNEWRRNIAFDGSLGWGYRRRSLSIQQTLFRTHWFTMDKYVQGMLISKKPTNLLASWNRCGYQGRCVGVDNEVHDRVADRVANMSCTMSNSLLWSFIAEDSSKHLSIAKRLLFEHRSKVKKKCAMS